MMAPVVGRVTDSIARTWRRWTQSDALSAKMDCCAEDQVAEIARDIGVPVSELHELVRLGPHAADLLTKRLAVLNLDRGELARLEPGVLQDMQRVCSLCDHHRRCAADLGHRPEALDWQGYCPNVATLKALNAMPWPSRHEW
jgi:hypothetical protein